MTQRPIYLDYHATTPVDPRVVDKMLPYFTEHFGNAASRTHAFGWRADDAVAEARRHVVELIGARSPDEIIFTSGATEANNLAIRGALEASGKTHVVTSAIEHPSVLELCGSLKRRGYEVTTVGVDSQGLVDPADVAAAIRPDTGLVSIMAVNNEVGTIQPITTIGEIASEREVPFHCDASQAVGRIEVCVRRARIDFLSLSAHKIYGPKGVGALYARRHPQSVALATQQVGGSQERGRRAGTLNVPGIVGFGEAARLARQEWQQEADRLRQLRDQLLEALRRGVPDLRVNGCMRARVSSNLNLSFGTIAGDTFLAGVANLALSGGAACSSGSREGSHVLAAMGLAPVAARRAIRVSLGRMTKSADVEIAARSLVAAADRLNRR